MASVLKLLVLFVLITLVSGQSTSKQKSSSSAAGKTRYNSAVEQGRTLGILGPLLRLGLRRPLRTGLQSDSGTLADPAYGGYGGYNGYGGYPNTYNNYGGYSNYGQYSGVPGVGYGGGYRPPVAYPQYNAYTSPYQQQNYAGLNALSALGATANAPSATGAVGGSSEQQAQLATVLGQALGSSLRPLLGGSGGGRFGASAAGIPGATGGAAGGGAALAGLLSLFG